jgi:hypothetical protein
MTRGTTPPSADLYRSARQFCEERLGPTSIYRLLAEQGHRLFAEESFEDLFESTGRASVPPRVMATVMVLQRLEGLSDREAVERFGFDLRWKYAAGDLPVDYPSFVHTVLVQMRARLRRSPRPNRVFEAVQQVAQEAGLVGRRRVLDSTALYDAVATQDTVTMVRSALRVLLRVSDAKLTEELRSVLRRDDDYATAGKPTCDWDDEKAREELIDALTRDANAVLERMQGLSLPDAVQESAKLLATVVGQDIAQDADGVFRIARRVAPDRVISTVDAEARHGHKTESRGFDGYKGHIAVDPDSELITATEVTAGNAGDASVAEALLGDLLDAPAGASDERKVSGAEPAEVYGDASYGSGELVERLEAAKVEANVKVQPPVGRRGMFTQDDFIINLEARTVECPAGLRIALRMYDDGSGEARFGVNCDACAQRSQCTASKSGRTVWIHPKHRTLTRARTRQRAAEWKARYRATRPKVERKIAHLMRRRHGGRRARMRGRLRVGQDFALLAAAVNLRRLAVLGVRHDGRHWMKRDQLRA